MFSKICYNPFLLQKVLLYKTFWHMSSFWDLYNSHIFSSLNFVLQESNYKCQRTLYRNSLVLNIENNMFSNEMLNQYLNNCTLFFKKTRKTEHMRCWKRVTIPTISSDLDKLHFNPWYPLKDHTYLNKHAPKSCKFV